VAPPLDLREWIALLEREGELTRVAAEVNPELEITEIADRAVKAGGPALLFEHPKGSKLPLLINQFGSERRICLALGVEKLDEVAGKLASLMELELPKGARAKLRKALDLKSAASSAQPRKVRRGACQEIVLTGDEVDLGLLPVQHAARGDHARSRDGRPQRRHVPDAGRG
jgi:4-hydroxy-3-polyprenylbenzoate decarboxylase